MGVINVFSVTPDVLVRYNMGGGEVMLEPFLQPTELIEYV